MHRVYFPTNSADHEILFMSNSSKPPAPSEASKPTRPASYLPLRTVRVREAMPVVRAVQQAPSLAGLMQLAQASNECLRLVAPLMPTALRTGVQAGPLQDGQWCLLAANSAVAAKLRQMTPAFAAHLRSKGHAIESIRIKIAGR
jgi:hypothetical protein